MRLQSIVRLALIVVVALFSSLSSYAQTQPAPTAKPRPKLTQEQHQQKRYDQAARELNLTPEQKAKFEQTDRAYDEKMRAKRMASKEEISQLRTERMNAHKALLNREQVAKYEQWQAKKQQHKGRKQHKGKGHKMQKKAGQSDQQAPGKSRRG